MPSANARAQAPQISVVTVTLNGREGLRQTLDSLLAQTAGAVEFLVVDGGSRDGTADTLRAIADTRLVWSSEPDRDLYDAMNKGVRRARAPWVMFVNGGDQLADPYVVADLLELLRSGDADLLYGDAEVRYPGGRRPWRARAPAALPRGMPFAHGATVVRRNLLLARPFRLGQIASDYEFLLACWRSGVRFKAAERLILLFESGGVSDRQRVRSTIERWRILRRYMRPGPALAAWYLAAVLRAGLAPPLRRMLPRGIARRLRHGRATA